MIFSVYGLVLITIIVLQIALFLVLNKSQKIAITVIDIILLFILIITYKLFETHGNGYWLVVWFIYLLLPSIFIDIVTKIFMIIYSKLISKNTNIKE